MADPIPPRTLELVDALAQTSFLVQDRLARHAAGRGLSLIQTRLLAVLRDRRPTINELARLLDLDKSSTSGLVDRAERRGLVSREPSARDRRSVHVTLTDAGREIVTEVASRFAQEIAELADPLASAERTALRDLLTRVLVDHAATRGVDLFDVVTTAR